MQEMLLLGVCHQTTYPFKFHPPTIYQPKSNFRVQTSHPLCLSQPYPLSLPHFFKTPFPLFLPMFSCNHQLPKGFILRIPNTIYQKDPCLEWTNFQCSSLHSFSLKLLTNSLDATFSQVLLNPKGNPFEFFPNLNLPFST